MYAPASPPRSPTVLHSADWLVPVIGDPISGGALLERRGSIAAVGPRAGLRRFDHDREQHWPGVIIPGLVNAHTHLNYSRMAELGRVRHAGFQDWAREFFAAVRAPGHDWYAAATEGARQALATGTTAMADVVTFAEALPALHDAGLKGIAYWELLTWSNAAWFGSGRAQTERLLKENSRLSLGISPHAPHTLDDEVISDLTALSHELGLRRHIHVAESESEHEFIEHGTGPHADALESLGVTDFTLRQRGGSHRRPMRYLDDLGGLGPDCHIAHGIYTDADDRATLRRRGTTVALCPRSNTMINLDEAPVADYLREGNAIAVGTDSLCSAPSLDLLADVAALADIARRQGYREDDLGSRLIEAATLGGARAMGLDRGARPIGALAPGFAADFAVVAVSDPQAVVDHGAGNVTATIIDGTAV